MGCNYLSLPYIYVLGTNDSCSCPSDLEARQPTGFWRFAVPPNWRVFSKLHTLHGKPQHRNTMQQPASLYWQACWQVLVARLQYSCELFGYTRPGSGDLIQITIGWLCLRWHEMWFACINGQIYKLTCFLNLIERNVYQLRTGILISVFPLLLSILQVIICEKASLNWYSDHMHVWSMITFHKTNSQISPNATFSMDHGVPIRRICYSSSHTFDHG